MYNRICIVRTVRGKMSVSLSVTRRYSIRRLYISSKFFLPSGSPTILVFHTKRDGNTLTGTPLTAASNASKGYEKNHDFRPISLFISE